MLQLDKVTCCHRWNSYYTTGTLYTTNANDMMSKLLSIWANTLPLHVFTIYNIDEQT